MVTHRKLCILVSQHLLFILCYQPQLIAIYCANTETKFVKYNQNLKHYTICCC